MCADIGYNVHADYMQGHLCKHVHRISMGLQLKLAKEEPLTEVKCAHTSNDDDDNFLHAPLPKKQKLAGTFT